MPKQPPPMIIQLLHATVSSRSRIIKLVLASLLLALYVARDDILLYTLRHQLKKVPGVQVEIFRSHLHPLFNGVTLQGVQVFRPADPGRKGPAGRPLRLASVAQVQVRWPWRGLLRGGLICETEVNGVEASVWRINKQVGTGIKATKKLVKELTPEPPEPETIVAAWPEIKRFLLPLAVDKVSVDDTRLWLRDCTTDPQVKWSVDGIKLTARNLTNREHLTHGRYATVDASATPAGGTFKMHMELDPLARSPTFGLRSSVDNVVMSKVNQVLRAYAKLDVESGTFNTRMEVVSEKGHFNGFVEPHIVNLKIRPRAEDASEDSVLNRLWRTAARAVTSLVENKKEGAIATKLPLAGEFVRPEIGVWDAVSNLLGNAYLQALQPPTSPLDTLPLLKPKSGGEQATKPSGAPGPDADKAATKHKAAASNRQGRKTVRR